MSERGPKNNPCEIPVTELELGNLSSFIEEVDGFEKEFRERFQPSTPAFEVKVHHFLDNLHQTRELFSEIRDELRLGRPVRINPNKEHHEPPTLFFDYSPDGKIFWL